MIEILFIFNNNPAKICNNQRKLRNLLMKGVVKSRLLTTVSPRDSILRNVVEKLVK